MRTIFSSSGPRSTLLIRLVVGAVFLSEGIQKFLFPEALGVGRFAKIGIPAPGTIAPFVGAWSIDARLTQVRGQLASIRDPQ